MAAAAAIAKCSRSFSSLKFHLNFHQFHQSFTPSLSLSPQFFHDPISTLHQKRPSHSKKRKKKNKTENRNPKNVIAKTLAEESRLKRRTRSEKQFDQDIVRRYGDNVNHVPVMLGEALDVFSAVNLRSFVDCTVGAAGHSCAIIQAHPEMQLYVGLDVDPTAHKKAQARINNFLHGESCH
ncbi:Ribosomal RNA small subunit methyltransferase H [Dillenia turbinata]|uniref:Ribosomal RNA small subunit methyltransferase H n=1 Tax=Dillenia turbinata TaxID=194707 RepID=A0AAN8UNV7_9MAGN